MVFFKSKRNKKQKLKEQAELKVISAKDESRSSELLARKTTLMWIESATELAKRREYMEALDEFTSLQVRVLQPRMESDKLTDSKLWALNQNSDVTFVKGKIYERTQMYDKAATHYKLAYDSYNQLINLVWKRKEADLLQLDSQSTILNSAKEKTRNKAKIDKKLEINTSDYIFHAETQKILTLEAIGSLSIKRNDLDLADQFYERVDELLADAKAKYNTHFKDVMRSTPIASKDSQLSGKVGSDSTDSQTCHGGSLSGKDNYFTKGDEKLSDIKLRVEALQKLERLIQMDRKRAHKILRNKEANEAMDSLCVWSPCS